MKGGAGWGDLQTFLALVRSGSVRGAGALLGVSHSTVARRLETLEERLGTRLFDRTRNGCHLTDAGRRMVPGAERIEQELAALQRALAGEDDRLAGPVSITCFDAFSARLAIDLLTPFCLAHPSIELMVVADARPYALDLREADLAIRALQVDVQPPDHLLARRLVPLHLVSYVARRHRSRLEPDAPGSDPRWVSFDQRPIQEEMVARSSHPQVPVWGGFASTDLMHHAVRQGLGVGLLPTYLGDPDPTLCRLGRADDFHVANIWLLCHPDLRRNARLREVRCILSSGFAELTELFTGPGGAASPHPSP